jgi:hypothetical protein
MGRVDYERGVITGNVYAWEATLTYLHLTFGQKPEESVVVTEKTLRAYRKAAREAQEKAAQS